MPFLLRRDIAENGAFLEQLSHWDLELNSGQLLPTDAEGPIEFALDPEIEGGGEMPTLFDIPTLVVRNEFVQLLRDCGVDNIEVRPTKIDNVATDEIISGYSYVNVIGIVGGLVPELSDVRDLGENVTLVDSPVLRSSALTGGLKIARLADDTLRVLISDDLAAAIARSGAADVYLQEVRVV